MSERRSIEVAFTAFYRYHRDTSDKLCTNCSADCLTEPVRQRAVCPGVSRAATAVHRDSRPFGEPGWGLCALTLGKHYTGAFLAEYHSAGAAEDVLQFSRWRMASAIRQFAEGGGGPLHRGGDVTCICICQGHLCFSHSLVLELSHRVPFTRPCFNDARGGITACVGSPRRMWRTTTAQGRIAACWWRLG